MNEERQATRERLQKIDIVAMQFERLEAAEKSLADENASRVWSEAYAWLNEEQRAMVVNLAKANLNERLERLQEELKTL